MNKCETCKWFSLLTEDRDGPIVSCEGRCRVAPPTIIFGVNAEYWRELDGDCDTPVDSEIAERGAWPRVTLDDWCSQHKGRPA